MDSRRVFVGSLNFDPRSARLNTEMGIVIDSSAVASDMRQDLADIAPRYAYKVRINPYNRLQWQDPDQPDANYEKEPDAGFWKRLTVRVLSVLPIEQLL